DDLGELRGGAGAALTHAELVLVAAQVAEAVQPVDDDEHRREGRVGRLSLAGGELDGERVHHRAHVPVLAGDDLVRQRLDDLVQVVDRLDVEVGGEEEEFGTAGRVLGGEADQRPGQQADGPAL